MTTGRFLIVASAIGPLADWVLGRLATASGLSLHAQGERCAVFAGKQQPAKEIDAARGSKTHPGAPCSKDAVAIDLCGLSVSIGTDGLIVRADPTGSAPCFWCRSGDWVVAASDPDMLRAAGGWTPRIDWEGLAFTLYASGLPAARTALLGCNELLPGFALTIGGDGTVETSPWWSPWPHALQNGNAPPAALATTLSRAIGNAAARFDHILVAVSGGLDSSLVAAALASSGHRFACVTVATEDPDGDERSYARALAAWLGVELVELCYRLADIDIDRAAAPAAARPTARTHEQSFNRGIAEVFAARGHDALFTGNGGDALFCLTQSGVALADRLLAAGPGPGALQTLSDICRLTGAGPVPVARMAMRRLPTANRRYRWQPAPTYLAADVLRSVGGSALDHPWLEVPRGGLPGRAVHIAMLLRVQQALGVDRGFTTFDPLMTRDTIELALTIPTWRWVEGGVDRAIARQAFASRLPAAVLGRRVKGGPDSFGVALIERFRGPIMAKLVHGRLAAHGIIAADEVEAAVRRFGPGQHFDHVRLLQLLEAENWVAHWEAQAQGCVTARFG